MMGFIKTLFFPDNTINTDVALGCEMFRLNKLRSEMLVWLRQNYPAIRFVDCGFPLHGFNCFLDTGKRFFLPMGDYIKEELPDRVSRCLKA